MSKTEYSRFNFIYSLLLILFIASSVFGEGTKELTPKGGETATRVQVGTDRVSNFATYTSTPDKRMYIHIEDFNNEKIFLGFGKYYDNDYNEKPLYYRLKDPAGNIVIPGQRVPVKDSGHIKTHKEAVIGPLGLNGSVGGYTPIEFKPSMNGDYYIEFSTDNTEIDNENPSNRRVFEYFDITVGGSDFNKLPGRLWAYTWSLYSCGMSVNSYAKFFIYTKDSVVTRLDLNGMRPCGFGVLANQNGTTSSSVFAESRKSTSKNTSYPEYKIFLNDPDNISYPSFTTDVKLNDSLQLKGCFNSGYCIRVNTTKDATGEILIDFNGNRKLDGNDRLLILDLKAGDTCIPWDGMDAQGKLIASGFKGGKIYLKLYKGLTNFPIYDPENNDDGIKVDVWRDPAFADGKPTKVFWDDSNIPKLPASPPVKNLEGCLYTNSLTGGCHVWNKVEPEDFNGAGNENTMNTWWYVFEYNDSTNIVIDAPPLVDAGKDVVVCNKAQTIDIGSLTSTK